MGHRIAIATTDGLTIYKHFGQADEFYIYDIDGTTYELKEKRTPPRSCGGQSHNEGSFDIVLEALSDCEAIVVGKIGYGAADYLRLRGMRVFEAPGMVEQIMGALINNGYFEEDKELQGSNDDGCAVGRRD